jgi:hypothetical protein
LEQGLTWATGDLRPTKAPWIGLTGPENKEVTWWTMISSPTSQREIMTIEIKAITPGRSWSLRGIGIEKTFFKITTIQPEIEFCLPEGVNEANVWLDNDDKVHVEIVGWRDGYSPYLPAEGGFDMIRTLTEANP